MFIHACTANVVPTLATLRVINETQKQCVLSLWSCVLMVVFHKNSLEGVVDPLIIFHPEPFNLVVLKSIGATDASVQDLQLKLVS